MDSRSANMMKAQVPYMRETFAHEVDLIEFDGNFNIMDASLFAGNAQTKDLESIRIGIDSLNHRIDSVGAAVYDIESRMAMERQLIHKDSKDSARIVAEVGKTLPFDTLYKNLSHEQLQATIRTATSKVRQLQAEYEFRRMLTDEDNRMLRIHKVEAHKKFTYSLACLLFFFIGAPLGAIIRKGGLGMPVIISVGIFIFYYIVNVSGEKMAKTGIWYIPFGVWLSSMVLAPLGAFLTYKSNQDSAVFNIEGYRMFLMRLFGLRESRKLNRKDVIINEPDYPALIEKMKALQIDCQSYTELHHLMRMPNYKRVFFEYEEDTAVIGIDERLEDIVEELHNSRDSRLIAMLNEIPVMVPDAHTRPFHKASWNIAAGIIFPIGLFFWFRIWRYRLRLWRDMTIIKEQSNQIINRIENKILNEI